MKRLLFPDLNIGIILASFILSGTIPDLKERVNIYILAVFQMDSLRSLVEMLSCPNASFGFERAACVYEF